MQYFQPNQEVLYEPTEEHKVNTFYIKDSIPSIFIKYVNNREKAQIKLLDSQTFEVDPYALKLRQCSDRDVYQAYLKPQHVSLFTRTSNLLRYYLCNIKKNVRIDRFYVYYTIDFNIQEFKGAKILINDSKAFLYCLKDVPQLQKYIKDQLKQSDVIRIYTKQNYIYVNNIVLQASQLGMQIPWLPVITYYHFEEEFYKAINNTYQSDKQIIVIIGVKQVLQSDNNIIFVHNLVKQNQKQIISKQNKKQISNSSFFSNVSDKSLEINKIPPNSILSYKPGSLKVQKNTIKQKSKDQKVIQSESPKYHYHKPLSVKMQTSIINGNFHQNMSKSQVQNRITLSKVLTSSQPNKYIDAFEEKLGSRVKSEYEENSENIQENQASNIQSSLFSNQNLNIQTELVAYDVLRREINQYELGSENEDNQEQNISYSRQKQNQHPIMFIQSQNNLQTTTKSEINLDDLQVIPKQLKQSKRDGSSTYAIALKPQFDVYGMMSQLAQEETKEIEKQKLTQKQARNVKNTSQYPQSSPQNLKQLNNKAQAQIQQTNNQNTQKINLKIEKKEKTDAKQKTENQPNESNINVSNQTQPQREQDIQVSNEIKKETIDIIKNDHEKNEVSMAQQKDEQQQYYTSEQKDLSQQSSHEYVNDIIEQQQYTLEEKQCQNPINKEKENQNEAQQIMQALQSKETNENSISKSIVEQLEKQYPADQLPSPVQPLEDDAQKHNTTDNSNEEKSEQHLQSESFMISQQEQHQNLLNISNPSYTEVSETQQNVQTSLETINNVIQGQDCKQIINTDDNTLKQSIQSEKSEQLSYRFTQLQNSQQIDSNQAEECLSYVYKGSPAMTQKCQEQTMSNYQTQELPNQEKEQLVDGPEQQENQQPQIYQTQTIELKLKNVKKHFVFDNSPLQSLKIGQFKYQSNDKIHKLLNNTIDTYKKVNQMLNTVPQENTDLKQEERNQSQAVKNKQVQEQPKIKQEINIQQQNHPQSQINVQKQTTQQLASIQQQNINVEDDPLIKELLSKKKIQNKTKVAIEKHLDQQKESQLDLSKKELQKQLHDIQNNKLPQISNQEPFLDSSVDQQQTNEHQTVASSSYNKYQLSQTSPQETNETKTSQSKNSKYQLSDKIHLKTIGVSQLLETEKDQENLSLILQKSMNKSE